MQRGYQAVGAAAAESAGTRLAACRLAGQDVGAEQSPSQFRGSETCAEVTCVSMHAGEECWVRAGSHYGPRRA